MKTNNRFNIGFTTDGSFLPIRNGTNYSIIHLMNALQETGKVSPTLINAYRGWDDPKLYFGQKFNTIFLPSEHYYEDNNIFNYTINVRNIKAVHIFNSDEVLNMGARLQRNGVKIIFEVINIDHVLYSQFWKNKSKLAKISDMQKRACNKADHVLTRSEVDKKHLVDMGVNPEKITIYSGAIDVDEIKFRSRINPRYKILFLGHMYYPPNEEALKLIVDKVLPLLLKMDSRYTVTVVGNTPNATMETYKNVTGLVLKGGLDNISDILDGYDIGIAPLYQGSGTRLKLLDYMASGLPVITTNLGVEGLKVEVRNHLQIEDDIDKYAELINHTMKSLPSFAEQSKLARAFVEKKYSWKTAIDPFIEVYKKLIRNKK